ncbi:MAG: hypothetical protein ABIU29_03195 [Chthoniobacterales bacterium]
MQPKDPKNFRNRVLTYRLMGDAKKSKADNEKAIELSPKSASN